VGRSEGKDSPTPWLLTSSLRPRAEQDIDDAHAWYEARQTGLGDDFLQKAEDCYRAFTQTPEMHAVIFKKYRRALLRRFPYAVIYEYENGTVTIHAVAHCSQNPARWQSRLP
jgi:plasmid stabilization system protein ParE